MRTWELIRQALSAVFRSKTRSALTILGVAIACGALVSMVAFAVGLQAKIEEPFQELGLLNNIEVFPRAPRDEHPGPASQDQPTSDARRVLGDEQLRRFEEISGVDYAYPDLRLSSVEIRRGDQKQSAFAMGVAREITSSVIYEDLLIAGTFFAMDSRPEILLGESVVSDLGFPSAAAAIGSEIELRAEGLVADGDRTFNLQEQVLRLTVVGVFRPPGATANFRRNSVLVPVELMRNLPGSLFEGAMRSRREGATGPTSGYSRIIVRTKSPSLVRQVDEQIRELGYDTRALVSRLENVQRAFVFLEVLLAAVGTVALLVAGLGILNTLLMTVLERYREIGLYKAIGASNGDVRTLFLTEAAVLGLLGGVGGLLLARLVCALLQFAIDVYARRQNVDGVAAVFQFPAWLLGGAVLFSVVISILSGLYPAHRAASVDPIEALRRE